MRIKQFIITLTTIYLLLSTGITLAQHVAAEKLREHVYILASDSLMGRGFGTQGGRMAADYIGRNFEAIGLKPWKGSYLHPFISQGMMLKTEGANIIGWVEGSDSALRHEFIVLGAHYDHLAYKQVDGKTVVYNGADDNASGVSAMIEIAGLLVQQRDSLKRSIVFVAFDGEEAGLIGSTYLVRERILPVDSIKFMFSLDMVGMLSKYGGVDLVGSKTLARGHQFFTQLALKHGIAVRKEGRRVEQQTDTQPFGSKGIPSVHVFTSTVSPYHRPEDDADKLDYDGMARIANFVAEATVQLANADVLQPDNQFKASGKSRFSVGYQFGLGNTFHEYKDEFYNSKAGFTFNAGLVSVMALSNSLDFQVGALYQTCGTEHQYGRYRSHEVLVPAALLLYFGGKNQQLLAPNLYLIGGGYYSYRFAGKIGDGTYSMNQNIFKESYGFQLGIGFNLMNLNFQMVRQMSLKSIEREAKIIPSSFLFSLGYQF